MALFSGWGADRIGRKQALLVFQSAGTLINLFLSFMVHVSWAPGLIVFHPDCAAPPLPFFDFAISTEFFTLASRRTTGEPDNDSPYNGGDIRLIQQGCITEGKFLGMFSGVH